MAFFVDFSLQVPLCWGMSRILNAITERALKRSFRFFEAIGVHVLPVHFYSPIPDTRLLRQKRELFRRECSLHGIEMREDEQIELMNRICPKFRDEYGSFPVRSNGDPTRYHLANGSFGYASGQMHYCIVRDLKPKRIIEIGSGHSTLATLAAVEKNDMETDKETSVTAIEPYPMDFIDRLDGDRLSLVRSKVEDVDPVIFDALSDGDLLFIDSSHVSKFGSDVNFEMFEVLPRLAKGVVVHIHDIQFPFDYWESYILDEHHFWNEQYVVQAFLMYNDSFEIVWCGSYMTARHPDLLERHFPHFDPSRVPTGLYIRRTK